MTREELVKAVEDAWDAYDAAQSKMLSSIDAQMLTNPELITPADESQLDRLDELLKEKNT